MAARRADGEDVLAAPHEDDLLAIDMALDGDAVGERVHRETGPEIGPAGALRLYTHDALLPPSHRRGYRPSNPALCPSIIQRTGLPVRVMRAID